MSDNFDWYTTSKFDRSCLEQFERESRKMPLQKDAPDYIASQRERTMTLNSTTFDYLKPTDEQMGTMSTMRAAAQTYARMIETHVPEGPDKTYLLRKLREVGMWVNVAITRHPDGAPRVAGEHPEYPPSHPAPGDLGSVPL